MIKHSLDKLATEGCCTNRFPLDMELLKILKDECKCRAAAHTGEERRFFQSLVYHLGELVDRGRCGKEETIDTELGRPLYK